MTACSWLAVLTLGMVAGATGQLVGAVVGLRKSSGADEPQTFEPGRLISSIVIGAKAGAPPSAQRLLFAAPLHPCVESPKR